MPAMSYSTRQAKPCGNCGTVGTTVFCVACGERVVSQAVLDVESGTSTWVDHFKRARDLNDLLSSRPANR